MQLDIRATPAAKTDVALHFYYCYVRAHCFEIFILAHTTHTHTRCPFYQLALQLRLDYNVCGCDFEPTDLLTLR